MKFSLTLLALGATASATNTPTRVTVTKRVIMERDLATIQGVLASVSSSLSALNAAATASPIDIAALTTASNNLNDALTSGASTVQGTSDISVNDAITLQSSSADLQTTAQTLTDSLNAAKPQIQNAGACSAVREQVATINTNSQTLINAVVSKVPMEIQSVAAGIVSGFTATLQQNTGNYAEGSCVDAAGAGGGASSSSSASASETSSAATGATTPTASATTGGGATGTTPATSQTSFATAGAGAVAVPVGMGLAFAALLL